MIELTQVQARAMIEEIAKGTPPQFGLRHLTAGLDPYLSVIEDDYLSTHVPQGGSAFKMVVGTYGGGKTHFLYSIRDRAWSQRFAVSYVGLSPGETPFHRLDLVYGAIVRGLEAPPDSEEEVRS